MIQILAGLIALIGLGDSIYIYLKKHKKQPLVCTLGGDCNAVLEGEYAKTLGIPNEILGMLYYTVAAVTSGALFIGFNPTLVLPLSTLFLIATTGGALFSLYLIYLQKFVIKEWCQYCLISAGCSITLFLTQLFAALL